MFDPHATDDNQYVILGVVGLVGLTLIALCIIWPRARLVVCAVTAALALIGVLIVLEVIWTASRELDQGRQARERIATTDVRLEALELSVRPQGGYRLGGFIHNLSTRYTLTDLVFQLIVEDCVARRCGEQARGHAEVIHRVPPGQTVGFDTDMITLPFIAPSIGERRLSYHVWNTLGIEPEMRLKGSAE